MGKQSWKAGNMLNPVPAVMVSVADQNHRPNIITVAWAGTVCTNPPMVSISVRPSRYSYEIIEKTGEFVINLTNEKLAKACDYCGVVSGRDVDKFKKTGLTPVPVENVKAPAIAESPVNIACRVVESHPLGSHTMFVAEVLGVTVDDAYLDETGKFDINGTGLIMYSHGEYFALGKKLGKFGYSVQKKKKCHAAYCSSVSISTAYTSSLFFFQLLQMASACSFVVTQSVRSIRGLPSDRT